MTTKPKSQVVNVLEADRTVWGYLPETGTETWKKQKLGLVTTRSFENEDLSRLYFRPSDKMADHFSKDPKDYAVGHTSDQFQIIDHAEVIQPLLDLGYTIKQIHYHRGGLNMMATLNPPKPMVIADPIHWDKAVWGGVTSDNLIESVHLTSGIKPGKGINARRGWFRLICTNGLVSEILSLGSAHFSHTSWSPKGLHTTMKAWPAKTGDEGVMGPIVGNRGGVVKFANLLQAVNTARTDEGLTADWEEEDITRSAKRQAAVLHSAKTLPMFIRDELETFTNTPGWMLTALIYQLQVFGNQKRDTFHALDLVNTYTNAANKSMADGQVHGSLFRTLSKMESALQSAMKLIGGFSM